MRWQEKCKLTVLASGMGLLTMVAGHASAALMGIDSATFTDSPDENDGGNANELSDSRENDPTTLLSITANSMTYSTLKGATSASNFTYFPNRGPDDRLWPGDPDTKAATDPGTTAAALAKPGGDLEVLDGGVNLGSLDIGFGTTLGSTVKLFIMEVTGNDKVEVQGMLGGSTVGSIMTIQASDWGADLVLDPARSVTDAQFHIKFGNDENNGTIQPIAGVLFDVADLGAANIDGLRIIDNDGAASFDPLVIGYVFEDDEPAAPAVPEPATVGLIGLAGLALMGRRRQA